MCRTTCLFVCILVTALLVSIARSDDKPASPDKAKQDQMMADYMKMAQPGPEHERLKAFAGDWDADVKTWNPDGSAGAPSKGVMHAKMMLGDRFLVLHYEGQMDMGDGMKPFRGMGMGAYDRGKKKYVNVWVDEMSTGVMTTEGTAEGNVLTCEGTTTDPMSGQPMKVKEVMTDVDKDHHKYELHMSGPDGKMMKMLEIVYTRKSS
jgi:hypothetical protein